MKALPEEFKKRMQMLLKEEYREFLESYERRPERGIRLNLQKLCPLGEKGSGLCYGELTERWGLSPVQGARPVFFGGREYYREFYLDEQRMEELGIQPGRHPYHEAGIYYIQEPSAMRVVPELEIRPYDRVLDLCASPGGKSTQAADALSLSQGGFLIANEYVGSRARVLSSNIERMGIANAAVLNEDSGRLAERFPEYFSRIILDAPCSGEGMFRKDEGAIREWSVENVERCMERQREIAGNAVKMLAPGGRMSYSTCTFEPGENEEMAEYILSLDSSLRLLKEERLWPHRSRGEGHFLAIFEKAGKDTASPRQPASFREERSGELCFLVPDILPELSGLRVLRAGVLKDRQKKDRREPEHALSHALSCSEDLLRGDFPCLSLPAEEERIWKYLQGYEIAAEEKEIRRCTGAGGMALIHASEYNGGKPGGFLLIAADGAVLGFGKLAGGRIKNFFPKGLRFMEK